MFYVKTQVNEDTYITSTITDENVYTTCIDCGQEMQVDLDEMVIDGHIDLYGLGCRCETCSYAHALKHRDQEWAEMLIADYEARRGA